MRTYIKPSCMSYYYDADGVQQLRPEQFDKGIAYTSDGYLLPCCWCDAPSTRKDFERLEFYGDSLKLANNESVGDILYSNVWKNFINIILHHPNNAPRCCREKCGVIGE